MKEKGHAAAIPDANDFASPPQELYASRIPSNCPLASLSNHHPGWNRHVGAVDARCRGPVPCDRAQSGMNVIVG